jgi:hypothetical protein
MSATLFELFERKIVDQVVGLEVQMSPCRTCGCIIASISEPFAYVQFSLNCQCGIERGRLSYETWKFLYRVVECFGCPTTPIKLKLGNYLPSSSPSGADVATDN